MWSSVACRRQSGDVLTHCITTWVDYRVAEPAAHVVYLRRLASGALYARRVAGGAIQLVYSIREFLRVAWSGGFRCAAA